MKQFCQDCYDYTVLDNPVLRKHSGWINRFLLIAKWLSIVLKGKRRKKREIKKMLKMQGDPLAQLKENFNAHRAKQSTVGLKKTIFNIHNAPAQDARGSQNHPAAFDINKSQGRLVEPNTSKPDKLSHLTTVGGAISRVAIDKPGKTQGGGNRQRSARPWRSNWVKA